MIKRYILALSYEGKYDINSDRIICVGTKRKIMKFVDKEYEIAHVCLQNLFKAGSCEVNYEKQLYLLEHKIGYALMIFCPGGSNELVWFTEENIAIETYNKTLSELQQNTDDEYVYSINLYKITNNDFVLLFDNIAPYM